MATTDMPIDADARRRFAVDVVRLLREKGFEALWAGGCVRDALLGKIPKDYDVASSATPDEVIALYGRRRTVAVGASFGVVMVLGPDRSSGQIEVATFRSDGAYLDGRRPSTVVYSTPEQDAKRRDFTINGMFFDPLTDTVIDYVGGRDDLKRGLVRAIGSATARIEEDKLRMLRAVRFASTFGYELHAETAEAIHIHSRQLTQVSVERISQELRRMLADGGRERAFRLLSSTGLLDVVFPELSDSAARTESEAAEGLCGLPAVVYGNRESTAGILHHLRTPRFEPALAAVLLPLAGSDPAAAGSRKSRPSVVATKCRQLKLSNDETSCVGWLVESLGTIAEIATRPLHVLKPLLADERSDMLLDLAAAVPAAAGRQPVDADYCRRYLSRTTSAERNPEPLVDGRDVRELRVPSGPFFRQLLETVRREQLDEKLATRESALARLRELASEL